MCVLIFFARKRKKYEVRQGCREMGEISQTLVDQARFGVRGAGWFEGRSLMRAHSGPELRVLATSSPLIESTFPASIFRRTVRKSAQKKHSSI